MKQYIFLLPFVLTLLLSACGTSESQELDAMKSKLEEKKERYQQLEIEINELEKEIAKRSKDSVVVTGRLITTRAVEQKPFSHFIDVQGLVEADKNINITAEMSGNVTEIVVREGARVRKGQTIIRLNDQLIRNNIDEVETSLELATTTYERQKNLWEQNIGSEIQYLQAKNQKESLEKNLATLQTQLSKLNIKSPIDGVVDEIFVRIGEMVSTGMSAARIVNLEQVNVKADVPERFLKVVHPGEKVMIRFPALGTEKEAEISSVGQFINPGNRTFKADIRLNNENGILKPNLLSVVRIMDYFNEDAIVVPTRLVQHYFDEEFIYVVDKNEKQTYARKRNIVTGRTYGGITEILEGLEKGELLVDAGYRDIADGQKVQLKN